MGCYGGGFKPPQNHRNQNEQTNSQQSAEEKDPGIERLKGGSSFLMLLALSVGIAAAIYFM